MIIDGMTMVLGIPAIILVAVTLWNCIYMGCSHRD